MHADIKVGLTCNNSCLHCIMHPVQQRMADRSDCIDATFEAVSRELDIVAEAGCDAVTLTGGEITLREDFTQVVEYALGKGFAVTVQTNGRRLTVPETVNFLAKAAVQDRLHFVIALHGSTAQVHEQITRQAGSFAQTLAGIKCLTSLSYRVSGKFVLSKINLQDLPETVKLFSSYGVGEIVIAFPHAEEFEDDVFEAVVPRYNEVRESLFQIGQKVGCTLRYETIPYCCMPFPEMWIDNMDLFLAIQRQIETEHTYIHSIMSGSTIDWSEQRIMSKRKDDSCRLCLMDNICEGVWEEYANRYGTSELKKITDYDNVKKFILSED